MNHKTSLNVIYVKSHLTRITATLQGTAQAPHLHASNLLLLQKPYDFSGCGTCRYDIINERNMFTTQ